MPRLAIYPGTFDPFTNGHLDVVERAVHLFDELVIGISDHNRKNPLFDITTRCALVRESLKDYPHITVKPFDDLLVRFAEREGATAIIRGLRVTSDFEYEFKMAQFIEDQAKGMEVVYLMASRRTLHISSTSVKELACLRGDVSSYVPDVVNTAIRQVYGY